MSHRSRIAPASRRDADLSRRQFLAATAGAVTAGALTAGAAGAQSARPPRTDVKMGISVDPVTPGDPRLVSGGLGGLSQAINHVYETLVVRDERMQSAAGLAERWAQSSPTTLRLFLRKGVKFHNGEPFDAQSVKYTIDSVLAPGSRSVWRSQIQAIKEVAIVDPHTVDVKTERPYRPLVRMIANVPIVPARAAQDLGDKLATTPIGTGPFLHGEYVSGDHWTVRANPAYWGPKPRIQELTWRYVRDDGARVAALLAGDVDVINNVPPDQIARLKASERVTVESVVSTFIIHVGMRTDRPPFSDRRVRQALNYAVNKEAIVEKLLAGVGRVADSPLAPTLPYRQSFGAWPYDPERARALLKEAGYDAKARPVVFGTAVGRYIKDREVGEAISGYLQAVGFEHRFETPDWPSYFGEVMGGGRSKYDMFLLGYGPQSMEPDQLLSFGFQSAPNLNASAYKNPQVDALLADGREAFDEARLRATYGSLTRLIWEDAPWIWLHYQPEITGFARALQGYGPRADSFWYLAKASW
jgi:peptide/nickel transport system substrate-binding protein